MRNLILLWISCLQLGSLNLVGVWLRLLDLDTGTKPIPPVLRAWSGLLVYTGYMQPLFVYFEMNVCTSQIGIAGLARLQGGLCNLCVVPSPAFPCRGVLVSSRSLDQLCEQVVESWSLGDPTASCIVTSVSLLSLT